MPDLRAFSQGLRIGQDFSAPIANGLTRRYDIAREDAFRQDIMRRQQEAINRQLLMTPGVTQAPTPFGDSTNLPGTDLTFSRTGANQEEIRQALARGEAQFGQQLEQAPKLFNQQLGFEQERGELARSQLRPAASLALSRLPPGSVPVVGDTGPVDPVTAVEGLRLAQGLAPGQEMDARTFQFAGLTEEGQPVRFNTATGRFEVVPTPGGGTIIPRSGIGLSSFTDATGTPQQFPNRIIPGFGQKGATPVVSSQTGLPLRKGENVSADEVKTLVGAVNTLKNLETLERTVGQSGLVKGLVSTGQVALGQNPQAIAFDVAQKNMRVDAQAIIKGIPSNFDVQTFIKTIPNLRIPESVNKERIQEMRERTRVLVENVIAFHKSKGTVIPDTIAKQLAPLGIDVNAIQPWNGQGDPIARNGLEEFSEDSSGSSQNKSSGKSSDFGTADGLARELGLE